MSRPAPEHGERIQQAAKPAPAPPAEAAAPPAAAKSPPWAWGWRWLVFFWITSFGFLLLYDVLRTAVHYIGRMFS